MAGMLAQKPPPDVEVARTVAHTVVPDDRRGIPLTARWN
jgi:hypothetical protein